MDLKPGNILIDEDEEGNIVAKLGDFGISKIASSRVGGGGGNCDGNNTT